MKQLLFYICSTTLFLEVLTLSYLHWYNNEDSQRGANLLAVSQWEVRSILSPLDTRQQTTYTTVLDSTYYEKLVEAAPTKVP